MSPVAEEMKNAPRDAPRVMIWSMVWAGVTAFLSAIVMCFTVGPNWADNLDQLSSYLSWFMNVTGSMYGGGIFCAVIMIGLNVSTFCASSRLKPELTHVKASDYIEYVYCSFPYDLDNGEGWSLSLFRLSLPSLAALGSSTARHGSVLFLQLNCRPHSTRIGSGVLCDLIWRRCCATSIICHPNNMRCGKRAE